MEIIEYLFGYKGWFPYLLQSVCKDFTGLQLVNLVQKFRIVQLISIILVSLYPHFLGIIHETGVLSYLVGDGCRQE